ncbi:MAG: tetratricopeptide repeat protein [Gammaproteobacteria bacterium]|nr:tetratricopeptide repeat protein [Gammaproteobacteria bacterium]
MKVFRWILSHLLLLVLVWTAVYIYLDWDNFREQLPVAVTDWMDNLSTRGVTIAEAPDTAEPVAELPLPSGEVHALAEAEQPAPAPEEALAEDTLPAETVIEQATAPATEAPEQVETVAAAQTSPETTEAAPAPAATETEDAHVLAASQKDLLIQAREAFWRRDLATAEELYSKLAEAQPGNPDLWGELGNLYFSQNKIKEASDAYYKAAEILIEEGHIRQVENLMGIIGNVDQEKARELFERMQSKYPQQPMYMR